jgi:hypothetical protein
MVFFSQRYEGPDDKAVRDKKPVDAGTIGPYSPASTNPESYKNLAVSSLRKNPPSQQFYSQAYSQQDAQQAQARIDSLGGTANFSNPGDQSLAQDFLNKYIQGGQRGLLPQDEMITQQTIAAYQSQQPGQGIGDGNVTAASRIKYPGATGTKTS